MFADVTMLYKSHSNLRYLNWCVLEELKQLMDWFQSNILTLNLSKTVCMFFRNGKATQNFEVELNDVKLQPITCTKFIDVWIDDQLKRDLHVNKLILKIKRNMHLLRNVLNTRTEKIVYFAHAQSHVNYCISVQGNLVRNSKIEKLQKLLKQYLKLVRRNPNYKSLGIFRIKDLLYHDNLKFRYRLAN